ncbi:MAG: hypothetical protein WCK58_00630 [Chloroflexota bacterium]
MSRVPRTLSIAIALVAAVLTGGGAVAPAVAATAPVPRVTIVVGPVGDATPGYIALAEEAAADAAAAGAEVVTVYSPNATWTAVRKAVEGASIVVYLGHGNGWPSPYRTSLYPPTQDGFGLNPVAGGDDSTHQYFGEASVAKLHLAQNAVVILGHLCYASGNSEPGMAEGTIDDAIARVDNYAAGFLKAGARAVVAESNLGPAYYVRSLLGGRDSMASIFAAAPSANDHAFTVASSRTPGYAVTLDPERQAAGFVRSLVTRGVTAAQLRAGAVGSIADWMPSIAPSLARSGLGFGEPALAALPVAGTTTRLTLPIQAAGTLEPGTMVSVRWDPLLLDPAPGSDPAGPGSPPPAGSGTTTTPDAPAVDLVVAEQAGRVVEPQPATQTAGGLVVNVAYPKASGLYRLTAMLHTPEGVAYDAATQALLTPVIVRVGGPVAAAYGVQPTLSAAPGTAVGVMLRVVNTGSVRWDQVVTAPPSKVAGEAQLPARTSTVPAHLIATWVSSDGLAVPDPVTLPLDAIVAGPGGSTTVTLSLVAPGLAGEYLLLVDVLSPSAGPISALGTAPALIRVTVSIDAVPQPIPTLEVPGAGG